ncbi:MAG TPA: TonB-dependent receptor, partial [Pedobacter sp.]|nr:TonB-dependent receptor [Pedobacter sp.]
MKTKSSLRSGCQILFVLLAVFVQPAVSVASIVFRSKFIHSYSAQQRFSVKGRVTDLQGNPLKDVTVTVKKLNISKKTDVQGNYHFDIDKDGSYELLASSVGYNSQSKEVKVSGSSEITLDFKLVANDRALDLVEVTGKTSSRKVKEQAYNVNVIDAKQLYNTSADLNQALGKTSGIRIREDGGLGSTFSFSLNGFSGRQVKFFLDGIPMDNFGSSLMLNNIPVNMAERVEVYKGVLPVSLGADALGGAVNIVTRTNPNYTDVSYGFGSFNTHKASVNHAYANAKTGLTFRANAFYNYSDNNYKIYIKPIINGVRSETEQEFERFHDGYRSIALQAEAGVTGKSYADKLLVGLIASGNDKDIQTGVTMDLVYGNRTTKSSSLIPTLKYKKSDLFVKGLDLSLYSAYNITQNRFLDTTRLRYNWFRQTTPTTTAESNRTQLKNKDNEALVTANLAYQIWQNHALSFNYVMTDYRRKSSDVENPGNITFLYPQQLNKQILGLAWQASYDQFTATVFSKLYLQHAKSYDQVQNGSGVPDYVASATNTSNVGYGAAAAYFVLPQLQVKASYEHTYRLPEAIELLGDGLFVRRNDTLKAEHSNNFNLGALYSFELGSKHHLGLEAGYIFRNAGNYIRLDQQQSQPVDR